MPNICKHAKQIQEKQIQERYEEQLRLEKERQAELTIEEKQEEMHQRQQHLSQKNDISKILYLEAKSEHAPVMWLTGLLSVIIITTNPYNCYPPHQPHNFPAFPHLNSIMNRV